MLQQCVGKEIRLNSLVILDSNNTTFSINAELPQVVPSELNHCSWCGWNSRCCFSIQNPKSKQLDVTFIFVCIHLGWSGLPDPTAVVISRQEDGAV